MAMRQSISKKTRFEVFKRDKFTCQYCGEAAPKVVLEIDHVTAVAEGGGNDILNLITSCFDCNRGKGARRLDDGSVVQKQHAQLAELQARREQIEMMLEWREALLAHKQTDLDLVATAIASKSEFLANADGKASIQRWLKRYSVELLLRAVDESFMSYLRFNENELDEESWEKAFAMVPAVANVLKQAEAKPYLPRLFYIQGILRKRLGRPTLRVIDDLERCVEAGATIESLERCAATATGITRFREALDDFLSENGGGA